LRYQLTVDRQELEEREENLRRYEAMLRRMQEEMDAGTATRTTAPDRGRAPTIQAGGGEGSSGELAQAWAKFHRAQQLFAAEQDSMVNERLRVREIDATLKLREANLVARENILTARENLQRESAARSVASAEAGTAEETPSAFRRLTTAPFAMTRALVGRR
jgi:hypothetical protein